MTRAKAGGGLLAVAFLAAAASEGSIVSGSYTGNGNASRAITGVGFRPDVVIVKGNAASVRAVVRTATMAQTKEMTGEAFALSGIVLSLDADGFTVSGNPRVNQAGIEYDWIAFQTVPGESRAGWYTGNGSDSRPITGLGFPPAYVIVLSSSDDPVYHRSAPMDSSHDFDLSSGDSDRIELLLADGFQVGSEDDVNRPGTTYHYVAWKAVPGRMAVGSYTGLRNDDRAIAGVGFRPVYVILKSEDSWYAVHKPASTGPATDASLFFNQNVEAANSVQALQADGFEVGSDPRVNDYGDTIYWMAWGAADGGRLVTSRSASTITVETPSVRMVWDEGKGAGLHQLYAKTEANPGTSRVGADAFYNLFTTEVNGLREAGSPGALELLETTPVRVRIRQRRDFDLGVDDAHLDRDWTVYGTPRLGIGETLRFDAPVTVAGLTGLHAKGQLTCSVANTFHCSGRSDAASPVFLTTDSQATYSDVLAIPYTSPFFGRAGTAPAWESTFEAGTPGTWAARVRETVALSASGSDTRFYLLHPRIEGLTPAGAEWQPHASDYRSPSPVAIAQGSPWLDAAEHTAAGDPFNEAESAYVLNADPVTGLDFSIDGSPAAPRRQPFFKIRQWRSLQEPAALVLQGTSLVKDRDFVAALKPVAHAVFCPDAACTTSTRLARGGLVGDADEYLADGAAARNLSLGFSSPGVQHLYIGADAKFRGLNVALQQPGTGSPDLAWEYWDGTAWADLEAVPGFTDLTSSLTRDGSLFWTADPPAWAPTSVVAGGPSLYYLRASLSAGATYGAFPVESRIATDVLLLQYLGSVTASGRRFALAPATAAIHYRSIGTRPPYGTAEPVEGAGTRVSATLGSTIVTGAGTAWRTANRGRGDRIVIEGFAYTVAAVLSETELELTGPYAEASGSGKSYTLTRKFGSLVDWEDCIDGPAPACEGVTTSSLVADNRNEVGILYRDQAMPGGLVIDGALTDANHSITLTADPGNRHYGRAGAPGTVALVNNAGSGAAILVEVEHVTLEWLEIRGGTGGGAHGVHVTNLSTPNRVVLQDLLVHHTGSASGLEIAHPDANVDAFNDVVYEAGIGMRISATPSATSRIRLLNNTVFGCNQGPGPSGIASLAVNNAAVTLRNNAVSGNNGGDYGVPSRNGASSHNLSGDATSGPAHSPAGFGVASQPPASLFVSTAIGGEDLHLSPTAVAAIDRGADLGTLFSGDVDAGIRSAPWDIGADEAAAGATDLAVAKDDGQASAVPGGGTAYVITVTNNGPAAVASLTMTDAVPLELAAPAFQAATRGVYTPATGAWDLSSSPLLPGQSASVTLLATIDAAATGTVANTATVELPPGLVDPVPQNNSATDTDDLAPTADLGVSLADAPDPADLGAAVGYTVTVANAGPSAATGVVLTTVLPAEMELDSAAPSQGSCGFDAPTQTLTCALGTMLPGLATVVVTARPRAVGTFTATASVVRAEPDPEPGNDTAAATTTVQLPTLAVRFMTVTSTSQRNVIEWTNPSSEYVSTELVFRTDRFPASPADGTPLYTGGAAGDYDRFVHDTGAGSDGQTHFYAAFVHRSSAPLLSPGRFVRGRPFDHTTGDVRWAFSTGGFSVTPPTVGTAAVLVPTNDLAVHAMVRGPAGGEWPAGWRPYPLGGPAQSRSPIVPITVGSSNPVMFLGTQDGYLHAIDAARGGAVPPPWPPVALTTPLGPVQAAPAGMFTAFGGTYDYLVVGTRDGGADNALVALDPATGAKLQAFDNGGGAAGIGVISGQATVDYGTRRVLFASGEKAGGSATTLWCLELVAPPTVFAPCPGWSPRALEDIHGSPVPSFGRIYVGSGASGGTVYSIDPTSPAGDRSYVHGDGPVKGFVFPDRNSTTGDVYFATDNLVWAFTDTGSTLSPRFGGGISLGAGVRPSPVLFLPGSHYAYVGGSDGKLHEIDVAGGTPVVKSVVLGDGLSVVGAPSYDWTHGLVHVGTEAGVFYAVAVPLGP
ncbi:MAG TPA: hypothetical protein VGB87_19305 [Vicinamibacteria bacterium]